jgi:hypothetical protein
VLVSQVIQLSIRWQACTNERRLRSRKRQPTAAYPSRRTPVSGFEIRGILAQFSNLSPDTKDASIFLYPTLDEAKILLEARSPFSFEGLMTMGGSQVTRYRSSEIWLKNGSEMTFFEMRCYTQCSGSLADLQIINDPVGPKVLPATGSAYFVTNGCYLLRLLATPSAEEIRSMINPVQRPPHRLSLSYGHSHPSHAFNKHSFGPALAQPASDARRRRKGRIDNAEGTNRKFERLTRDPISMRGQKQHRNPRRSRQALVAVHQHSLTTCQLRMNELDSRVHDLVRNVRRIGSVHEVQNQPVSPSRDQILRMRLRRSAA